MYHTSLNEHMNSETRGNIFLYSTSISQPPVVDSFAG